MRSGEIYMSTSEKIGAVNIPTDCGSPLVSAIITTHNRETETVLRAVRSVLAQTYPNIELIVVDDSSPSFEGRAEVEQSVRRLCESVVYLKHEECKGACAARNTGLSHAKGHYVGFLDDDDEWMPAKTEKQLKGFTDDKIALVYSQIIYVNDEENKANTAHSKLESGYIFKKLLRRNMIGSTSNPLLKKECVEAVGGFDVLMESCQDYDLWLRLTMRYPVNYIDAALSKYHLHSGSRITTNDKKRINGIERILLKYAEYYSKDDKAWYKRSIKLIPHYLNVYGRRKALALWFSCVKRCPTEIRMSFNRLAMIIMGVDLYNAAKIKCIAVKRRLKN